jgi:hypothetical protein
VKKKKKTPRRYALDSNGQIDPIFAEFMYGKQRRSKGVKIILGIICATILVNMWGYGLTSISAIRDFSEFAVDMKDHLSSEGIFSARSTATVARGGYNQQKASETDGGGYRPIGTGCPNGKQQRPDGWCPPLQRAGVDGRVETVGSWTNVFIPNGSIIPVDEHGNIRQLRAGEEGAYPEGSIYNDRNRAIQ